MLPARLGIGSWLRSFLGYTMHESLRMDLEQRAHLVEVKAQEGLHADS